MLENCFFHFRFLNPHQREVVHMLQYAAQASHELIPPETLEPVVKSIVNNFVTERNSGEVMAIGLNAMREIARRCPLVLGEDLLQVGTQMNCFLFFSSSQFSVAYRSPL